MFKLNVRTACVVLFGLLPIMRSPAMQAGADVVKRIATPMIGGVVTSAIMELLIYPVIYVIWRRRELPDRTEEEPVPIVPPALVPSHHVRPVIGTPKFLSMIRKVRGSKLFRRPRKSRCAC